MFNHIRMRRSSRKNYFRLLIHIKTRQMSHQPHIIYIYIYISNHYLTRAPAHTLKRDIENHIKKKEKKMYWKRKTNNYIQTTKTTENNAKPPKTTPVELHDAQHTHKHTTTTPSTTGTEYRGKRIFAALLCARDSTLALSLSLYPPIFWDIRFCACVSRAALDQ